MQAEGGLGGVLLMWPPNSSPHRKSEKQTKLASAPGAERPRAAGPSAPVGFRRKGPPRETL